MDKLASLFKSRRFWVAVSGLIAVFLEETGSTGVEVDPQTVENFILLLAAWIVGDSLRETRPAGKGVPTDEPTDET
jgi:hypothetical protein